MLGIYRLFGLFALLITISADNSPPLITTLKEKHRASFADPEKILNHYTIFLPIFALLYDHQTVKLLHRKEHLFFRVVKYGLTFLYWVVLAAVYFSVKDDEMLHAQDLLENNSRLLFDARYLNHSDRISGVA